MPSELDSQGSDAEGEQLGHGEADEGMESGEMDLDDEMIEDGDDMEEGEEEMVHGQSKNRTITETNLPWSAPCESPK